MGERLAIGLLGGARLQQGGREIACPSRKAVALLAYLVLTGRAHMRRELGALFWGRGNESAARTSLRTALQRLPAQVRPHVLADRDTVAWRTASEIEIDALRFAEAARGDDIAALTVASDLYAGELLAGFDPDATPEFDDWLLQERARHQQLASGVFERLIVRHREAAQNDAAGSTAARRSALDVANRWLQLEPAAEGAHRWLMRLYLDLGRRDAAVAQFDLCKRALAVATGRSPSGETQALLEAAAAAGGAGVTAREARPAAASDAAIGVPGIAGTSFVGRIEDLAALDALLAEPACRLVTLHGLGGAGKTRLAHACLSRVAGRFAQGAGWVALEDVTSADAVPSAIARAVGLQLPQRGDPVEGLAAAFKHQERLLVLDNVEHLLAQHGQGPGLAELALALLQAAPRLRLLVTSREVLGVQEEWIYAVNGLAVPGSEDANPLGGAFGAVDLFVQRARQSYLGFSAQAEMPHVLRICRLVDGLPLAIELAAAWVRSVPCGDIARAVEEEITALASRHRDRPPRHASLEAVVAYSWRMLTPEQQTALAALSVFVGGFAQRAAREVADAPLHVLSALVDKALVARHPAGRLGMHPLVRQFAGDRLEQSCSAALQSRRRHAEFFAAEIVRWRARLDGPQEMDADAEIAADDANLLAAAEHWIAPGGPHDLNALAEPLMRLLFGRSMLRALPGWADKVLADDRLAPAPRALTLTYRGRAVAMLGQLDAGQANFDAAITLATEHRLDYPLGFALIYAVGIAHERDELALARQQLARVEPLLVRLGDAEIKLRARFVAAVVADAEGRLGDAHAMLGEALEIARTLGAPMFMATIQSQLAETHLHQGHTDSALAALRESLVLFERLGRRQDVARVQNLLAVALLRSGQAAEAADAARKAARIFEDVGYPKLLSSALDTLGQAMKALGDPASATRHFERAIRLGGPLQISEARFHLGLLLLQQGDRSGSLDCARNLAETAQATSLPPVQCWSIALGAQLAAADQESTALARRWLTRLRVEPDLESELKREIDTLATKLPDPKRTPANAERLELVSVLGEVAAFLAASAAGTH